MKKTVLSIALLSLLMTACYTSQNSASNTNAPAPPAPQQANVPTPQKPSNKYQRKNADRLMPAAESDRVKMKAESVEMKRDTM